MGHDAGAEDGDEFYSHIVPVEWKVTTYMRREDILSPEDTAWSPYGTVGALHEDVPRYIQKILGEETSKAPLKIEYIKPDWSLSLLESIDLLKRDSEHQERAHEALVAAFLGALGYKEHEDFKYRRGRMDISLHNKDRAVVLFEVKRDWGLSASSFGTVKQAFGYALEHGIRFVVITNGDYYCLFDRLKGLGYEDSIVGEFALSALQEGDLTTVDELRPDNIFTVDAAETLRRVANCL